MNPLTRLIGAVFANVEHMSVSEAERVGEQLPRDHPQVAGRLLGAAARMKVAEHDAAFDHIIDQLEGETE